MSEIPLIYTTLGNVPVDDLEYVTQWEVTDEYIKLIERYSKDGIVVKESAHVLTRNGVGIGAVGGSFQ